MLKIGYELYVNKKINRKGKQGLRQWNLKAHPTTRVQDRRRSHIR